MAGKEKIQEQQETTNYQTIEELAKKQEVTNIILEGTKARYGWRKGKMVTESEFIKAVKEFETTAIGK